MRCPVCGEPMAHYRLYGYQCRHPEHNQHSSAALLGMRPEALTPAEMDVSNQQDMALERRISALEAKVKRISAFLDALMGDL